MYFMLSSHLGSILQKLFMRFLSPIWTFHKTMRSFHRFCCDTPAPCRLAVVNLTSALSLVELIIISFWSEISVQKYVSNFGNLISTRVELMLYEPSSPFAEHRKTVVRNVGNYVVIICTVLYTSLPDVFTSD